MSEQNDPREQVEASAEQDLEPKDLGIRSEEAEQVRGGGQGAVESTPKKAFEVTDYGFGVSMPVTTSRS